MKKIILLSIQVLFFTLLVNAQQNNSFKYFDADNKEITEKIFKQLRSTNKVLDIVGDSTNHKKLIKRDESGNIDRNKLVLALENVAKTKIDSNTTIIIVYYPGEDPCNSSGSPDRTIAKHKETERSARQIAKTKTFYIYKDSKGLERYNGLAWLKDPENLIEQLFFKYHYPCGSFAVISKTGEYISYFGEYPHYFIVNAVKLLNKK
jgi:hypothetical protein